MDQNSYQTVYSRPSWRERLKPVLSTALILLAAPLLAFFLTTFVFQSYEVEGPSMATTLQDNDRLIVLKAPRTWSSITRQPYVPHRGAIVIFTEHSSLETGFTSDKQLIKRVIALPGERILIKDGVVTVYNQTSPRGFQPDRVGGWAQNISFTSCSDVSNPVCIDGFTVPANEIFVMGDNRNNSSDSRAFGPVPVKDVVGTLMLRLFPLDKIQRFY